MDPNLARSAPRSTQDRSPFLKKHLMSIVFDEVEGRFFGAAASALWVRRAALGSSAGMRGRVRRRGGQGRAVRPARRGSLGGPRSQVVASHNGDGTPPGVPGRLVVGGHSGDPTIGAQSWAGQAVGFGCRPFLRSDGSWCMVCSGHSQAGCTQLIGLARRGPRRSSSSRLGCVRTVLNWPPGPGSGSRRRAARRRPR
jgi:hypothetical protein